MRLLVAAALTAAVGSTARAEFLPQPKEMMTPEEAKLFSETVGPVLARAPDPSEDALAVVDSLLARLREPTRFRGFIQFLRATILADKNRNLDAMAAIDESIRLLPGYSGPLITASNIYGFSNRAGQGADFLLRASEIDPQIVRQTEDYDVQNLLRRLSTARDERRAGVLSERLLAIGWTGTTLGGRSKLAVKAIRQRMLSGDVAGARAMVPNLLVPGQAYAMLSESLYAPLWPDIEKWGGPKLARLWKVYLLEARERWTATKDAQAAGDYASALQSAGRDRAMIDELLPRFSAKLDPQADDGLLWVVGYLAEALEREGRWKDADQFYKRVEKVWPLGSQANALNIWANHAHSLLFEDQPAEALALMDKAIADAEKWGDSINSDGLAAMHLYRVCMLHELGRDADASLSMIAAMSAAEAAKRAEMYLCLGNMDSARRVLFQALAVESDRGAVIAFMQKRDERPVRSAFGAKMRKLTDQLRSDPALLAQVRKYGRVMPYALNEGANAPDADAPPDKINVTTMRTPGREQAPGYPAAGG